MPDPDLQLTAHRPAALVSVDGRAYPLRSARLTAHAGGGVAASRLTQVFANPYTEPLEVVYTMPLPADGAVVGYTVHIGDRVIHGVVQRREEAKERYLEALAAGRSAGLLEQDRDDVFQQRLGNIPAHTQVEVEIQVLQRLAFLAAADARGAMWEYRFPTVVGVRYLGEPGRVPDAASVDVNRDADGGIPARLEAEVTVDDPGTQVTSPSHTIVNTSGVLRLAESERLDRDLVLHWPPASEMLDARLLIGGGLPGDDGRYALLTITPPRLPKAIFRRDLTVLLDASGSMSGEPIEHAKLVVSELLESLGAEDRFEILAFSNETKRLTGDMTKASPNSLRKAREALRSLAAGGGTEMGWALQDALKRLRKDSQRQILLVTDGQIAFERQITNILNGLPTGCRVHAVAIGSAPNRSLTAMVARAGHGVEVFANSAVEAREAARRLRLATAQPVVTDLSIEGPGLQRPSTRRLRDVFAGQPMMAAVQLRNEGGTLEVRGQVPGKDDIWVHRMGVPPAGLGVETPLPIGAVYSREVLLDLELKLSAGHDSDSVEAEMEIVAMRHGIPSRKTSLVAISEQVVVEPGGTPRRERIALELPAGVSAQGSGLLDSKRLPQYMDITQSFLLPFRRDRLATWSEDDYDSMPAERMVAPRRPPSEELMNDLDSSYRLFTSGLTDFIARVLRGLQSRTPAVTDEPPSIRIAAEELRGNLQREVVTVRTVSTRIASILPSGSVARARAIVGKLTEHAERAAALAAEIAQAVERWVEQPADADSAAKEIRNRIAQLQREIPSCAAQIDEVLVILEDAFPELEALGYYRPDRNQDR